MGNTFVIESNKRRIWDVSKAIIADMGKILKKSCMKKCLDEYLVNRKIC